MKSYEIEFTGVESEVEYGALISEKNEIWVYLYETLLTYLDDNGRERYKKAYNLQAYYNQKLYDDGDCESFTVYTKSEISSKKKMLELVGLGSMNSREFVLTK